MNKENFYCQELDRYFDTIEELKQAVSDYYEQPNENFISKRAMRRKGTSGKKKDGTKKWFFKK